MGAIRAWGGPTGSPAPLSSLSSGDPSAHRPHIRVTLIMWQPPDVIFIIVIVWLLPLPGLAYLFSFLLERRPQGNWCGLTSGPFPMPTPTYTQSLDKTTAFPSTSTSLACGPLAQVSQARLPITTPFPASHEPLALGLIFQIFSPRGIVRVIQKRTSPRGKPSTPGGGAVPPK